MALILIITKTLINMVEGALIKKYTAKHSNGGFLFMAVVSLFSMLFFLISDKNGLIFPREVWIYAIPAGICYCSASLFTYIAFGCGSFAMTMLLLSYSVTFTIVYGILFLNEAATLLTYAGIFLILISIYFVKAEDEGSGKAVKKHITPLWVVAITISMLGNGFLGILSRMQQIKLNDEYSNEFMIICLGISAAVLFIVGLFTERGKILYTLRYGGIYAALSGLSNGAQNMLGLVVNTMIPISIASPIGVGMKNVISFLFAVFIFKERFRKKQLFGVVLGTLAIILFNL